MPAVHPTRPEGAENIEKLRTVACWGGPVQYIRTREPLWPAWNEMYRVAGGRYVLLHTADGEPYYCWEGHPWPISESTVEAIWTLRLGLPFGIRIRLWLVHWLMPKVGAASPGDAPDSIPTGKKGYASRKGVGDGA